MIDEILKSAIEIVRKEKQRIYADDTCEAIDVVTNAAEKYLENRTICSEKKEQIRKIITSACASVLKDTINDLSAKGSIQRSIDYAMKEIMKVLEGEQI